MALIKRDLRIIQRKHRYILRFMNKFGYEPEDRGWGETALIYSECNTDLAMLLIRNGWDPLAHDDNGISFLYRASDSSNRPIWEILLRHEHPQKDLVHALCYALAHYIFLGKREGDWYILSLIEKLGGITPENCPLALYIAYANNALPYIPALMAAGFSIKTHDKNYDYKYRHYCVPKLHQKFLRGLRNFSFVNCDDYPLYVENGTVRARPEHYKKLWPHVPRNKKGKRGFFHFKDIKTMNFVAKWTLSLSKHQLSAKTKVNAES